MASRDDCMRGRARCGLASGLTLIEGLVVFFILLLVVVTVLPSLRSRCPDCSVRLVCHANLKGIGTSLKIYANENEGAWVVPAFDETAVGKIKYTVPVGGGQGTRTSPARHQPSLSGPGGATELSVTRAFWMLVRSGDETPKQYVCPNGGDVPDTTRALDRYYDFPSNDNISYGYQVPFGPAATRPSEAIDPRVVLAADKGPYVDATIAPSLAPSLETSVPDWCAFNSPNHAGEGQNVLYADGHVNFERTPIAGVDNDNIYTAALDNVKWESRAVGESPWKNNATPLAPVGLDGLPMASTDSLIFP